LTSVPAYRAVGGWENTRLLNAELTVQMVIQVPSAAAVDRTLFIQDTYIATVTYHFSVPLYRYNRICCLRVYFVYIASDEDTQKCTLTTKHSVLN
jgi:hypothetical protein